MRCIFGVWIALLALTALNGTAQDRIQLNDTKWLLPLNELGEPVSFVSSERWLQRTLGSAWRELPQDTISAEIVRAAESLPAGGAIDLPQTYPCGTLDLRRIQNDIQITGGYGGKLIFGGGQRCIQTLFCELDTVIEKPMQLPVSRVVNIPVYEDPKEIALFGDNAPASDLLGLFCSGSIKINQPVTHCAWIGGQNAFGAKTVVASAPVNDSLFLWFGINWAFADFNGHLDPKNKDRNWVETNSQMYFDCKGGGAGTRCYLMVETNYGNPGPGVVLKNCKGLAMYHGSTERASSQGPGVYWLKDCENVQLGLRRIFPATRGGKRGALPTHDITIEGGNGNILHNIEAFGNAQRETIVNSDPALQVWSVACDFEARGLDDALRFCYTPWLNKPEGEELEKIKAALPVKVPEKMKLEGWPDNDEGRKAVETLLLSGRDTYSRINGREEQTFRYGADDLTRGLASLSGTKKLPPPPSMPATNAPRVRRPVEFTRADGFGKALLDAGADPTGKTASDDAFAKLMYGMPRSEVQKVLDEANAADTAFRAARSKKDEASMAAAKEALNAAIAKLHPLDAAAGDAKQGNKKAAKRSRRPRIEIPTGTFLLNQPLVILSEGSGNFSLWGTGPETTTLKAGGDFKVLEIHSSGGQTFANLTIEGGKVGLAITGHDHNDLTAPTSSSYLAGNKFYNITFRGQSFAGLHIGRDEPDLTGGAEHDQNCYVNMKFIDTGDYGIYVNCNMLDKWLLLHSDFSGQKKAGISIKFNNLIHGGVIDCNFRNINGPGLDFMGGNAEIQFRPHQVMVDQCVFEECGNELQPAVDQGNGVCLSFTRNTITTRNKTIRTGYMGGAAIYEDIAIDVKTPNDGPALILRGARQNKTGRPNGHMLRNVKANAALAFINDANAHNAFFRKACDERGWNPDINWDVNSAAHELAPSNGWIHPFVLYECQFGTKNYAYSLLNVSTDEQKILREIDLSPLAK